ncbi:MAG TPA: hypothetical protein VNA20_05385 [Frankiaceae bacterium]|nr:hypothetical protein [Frankiaceae bacterium]
MPRHLLPAALLAALLAVPAGADPTAGCVTERTARQLTNSAPDETCVFVRPGVQVVVVNDDGDQVCQTNYLFYGSDGGKYLGIEGYCVLAEEDCTEMVVLGFTLCLLGSDPETDGPVVYPKGKGFPTYLDGKRIGEVRYAVYETGDAFSNFALIRLDPKVPSSASIRGWGGPTAVDRRITTEREDVLLTARETQHEGVATRGFYDARAFRGVLPLPTIGLGGPVLTAGGKAVGIVSTAADGAHVERVEPLIKRAGDRLRIKLRLATAPFGG